MFANVFVCAPCSCLHTFPPAAMHALRQYGKEYIALEEAAHQAHKGMWQGSFEMPADWRKDQKIDKLLAQRGESLQPKHVLPSQAYLYLVEILFSAK